MVAWSDKIRSFTDCLGPLAVDVARVIGRSTNVVRQLRAEKGLVPAEAVLKTPRARYRPHLPSHLQFTTVDLRAVGVQVEIGRAVEAAIDKQREIA